MLSGGPSARRAALWLAVLETGKLPALGERAGAAVPAATWGQPLLPVGLYKHSRVAWLQSCCISQIHNRLCNSCAVLGILGREEILLALVPAKPRLAMSLCSPVGRQGCPALPSPGLLAGRGRSTKRGGCKTQAAGKEHSRVSSGFVGARRSPDNRLWLFRVTHPPLWAWGGLL